MAAVKTKLSVDAAHQIADAKNHLREVRRRAAARRRKATADLKPQASGLKAHPWCNVYGVYTRGVRKLAIPIVKSVRITAALRLVHDPIDRLWRVGHEVVGRIGYFTSSAPVAIDCEGHAIRAAAIARGLRDIMQVFSSQNQTPGSAAHKGIVRAMKDVFRFASSWGINLNDAGRGRRVQSEAKPAETTAAPGPSSLVPRPSPLPRSMTPGDQKRLASCERVIGTNLRAFVAVGGALLQIREQRLYRETHESFETYCRERWSFSRQHAYRLIDASTVMRDLSPIGDSGKAAVAAMLPANEAQARALARIDPDQRPEVWQQIVKTAVRQDPDRRPVITQRLVEEKVREWITPQDEVEGRGTQRVPGDEGRETRNNGKSHLTAGLAPRAVPPLPAQQPPTAGSESCSTRDWPCVLENLRRHVAAIRENWQAKPWQVSLAQELRDLATEIEKN